MFNYMEGVGVEGGLQVQALYSVCYAKGPVLALAG